MEKAESLSLSQYSLLSSKLLNYKIITFLEAIRELKLSLNRLKSKEIKLLQEEIWYQSCHHCSRTLNTLGNELAGKNHLKC